MSFKRSIKNDKAQRLFDWVAWITAVFLALVVTIILISTIKAGREQEPTNYGIAFIAFLIGFASQSGLFMAPWVVTWGRRLQKVVFIMMLPSIFWLIRQAYLDTMSLIKISWNNERGEVVEHISEILVLSLFLLVYIGQAIRVSTDFLKRPPSEQPRDDVI